MQTSIEWLIKELYTEMNMSGDGRVLDEILEEAKEMHKQEIIDAYKADSFHVSLKDAEQYYQETFVSKGSDETLKEYHIVDTNEMIDIPKHIHIDTLWEIFRIENPNSVGGFKEKYEVFKWLYFKLESTLYTEEQVIGFAQWISGKYSFGNILGKWYLHENTNKNYTEKELFHLYIQSLKQPKKQ